MYSVIEQLDGSFLELCGVERCVHPTREAAIASLINGAVIMNGAQITKKDIRFGKEHEVIRTEVVWEPKHVCRCEG